MFDSQIVLSSFLETTPFLPWVLLTVGFTIIEYSFSQTNEPLLLTNKLSNLTCGILICIVTFVVMPFMGMLTAIVVRHYGHGLISIGAFPHYKILSTICAVIVFLLVRDFFFYLWHRLEHKIKFIWDIHAVHHSEQTLNGTSYMRQNWIDGVLQGIFINIPTILLLDISREALFDAFLVAATWDFFAHSDLRLDLGILSPTLTGPQLHRLHHSTLAKHQDKNFAQFFPIWDILFGTYVPPESNEYPPTGLHSGEKIDSIKLMALWPILKWAQRVDN